METITTHFDNPKKPLMIKALEDSLGNVSTAAKSVGINRATHYVWYENDPLYKNEVDSISDYAIDYVESKLVENITHNDNTAILFYLKCKGKKRGWIEKSEIQNTNINLETKEMTQEEIAEKLKRLNEIVNG